MNEQNIEIIEQEILELQQEKKKKTKGQSLVEYGLILALVSVVAITVLQVMGSNIQDSISTLNDKLQWANAQARFQAAHG